MIPDTFTSAEHYLGSFIYPLLEETRAQLAESMEVMGKAPYAEVIALGEVKKHGETLFNVNVDSWKNRVRDDGEPYKTLPGDMVLISDNRPMEVSDLNRAGWNWTLASVVSIMDDEEDDTNISTNFKVKMPIDLTANLEKFEGFHIVFLQNITTHKRIWNALRMRKNMEVIDMVLYTNGEAENKHCLCSPHADNIGSTERVGTSMFSKLNESQGNAVLTCLERVKCDQISHVDLIWGPPGTGKTSTISILLFMLLKKNCRTLICAPTNVAITQVASRVVKLVYESFKDEPLKENLLCPVGDVLLFGNNDRLKLDVGTEDMYLDYRVDKLYECLGLKGWRHCILSTIHFLEDCVSDYKIYVENELIKMRELRDKGETLEESPQPKTFAEFIKSCFEGTVSPLRRCMLILCTHLPRHFIQERNFQDIISLICLLDSLNGMLFQVDMGSEELNSVFSQPVISDVSPESFADTSSLACLRSQCVSILKTLLHSLGRLGLPRSSNKYLIRVLCLKTSTLVFCTTSSSYKIHSIEMEPFNVLVIDEAAQLRECESVIPLHLPGLKHAILVGDECQLPAIVHSKVSDEAGFGRSLFERLSSLGHSKLMLNVQYRMHPAISYFPNVSFYHGQVQDAANVRGKTYERKYLRGRMYGPYSFISIPCGKEELDDIGHSRRNMVEVALVNKIVKDLYKFWLSTGKKLSIGVISPYTAQVVTIKDTIGRKYDNLNGFAIKVKSIDGFQGGEEDIIIISTVRFNSSGNIGFMKSLQRTNVALTRARHCLWILGNERTLFDSNSVWKSLVLDAKERQCLFSADEDSGLSKTIFDVMKELDQLDDLLNANSIVFKSQRWKVLLSDNFKRSFKNLVTSRMKKAVLNLLIKLAGGWRPKRKGVDLVGETSSQIVKQFKVEGYYVVCTTDIQKEAKYTQVLRAWDLLSLDEVGKLLRRLDGIFAMYTDDFINLCKQRCLDGDLEVPKAWPASCDLVRFKNLGERLADSSNDCVVDGRSYIENSWVNESLLLMKFYSLSSGVVHHLLSDNQGEEIDIPFEVTDEEKEIIQFGRSSFILGRSGTGKTTVLTMKLFQREQQHQLALGGVMKVEANEISEYAGESSFYRSESTLKSQSEVDTKRTTLRQLFVTVSPKLCYAVKQHVSHLKRFAQGGKISAGNSVMDLDDLDGFSHFKDIPNSFVDIPDSKYPLVITFHKFLMMLDGTLGSSYFDRFLDTSNLSLDSMSRAATVESFIRTKGVSFDHFCCLYWPHFNSQLTKNLDPSRVFTEIISHIKGGLQVCETDGAKLTHEGYISMSENRTSTLNEKKREVIYDIFLGYEKMKMERGEFDLADLVNDLHLRLKSENLNGDKMDFVYIDEVQDLTMRQISLFKYICKNVNEGFVFSGDTAQTIARGIDFRFEDVRTLFYEEFIMKLKGDGPPARKDKGHLAGVSCLLQNFRTHAGVLRLAQSVIDILCHYFPQSIDALAPETSLIYGEAPVLLKPGSDENAIVTIFGNSGSISGKMVGFGAEQVILVRDESAKKEVSDLVGKQALILTIVECKGLEFQDVLLYNFFGSSPLRNQWRVVYEFMKQREMLDSKFHQCFPCFCEARHTILCSELKQLYVAITRTRQRLWICESIEEFSKPMFDYWMKMCLVEVREVDNSLAQAMKLASTPEQWRSRGIKLFWEKNYEMAIMCFERAGEKNWEKRTKATSLREAADRMRDSNPNVSCTNLREAAEIFESIGRSESAAECFCDLKEYELAGTIYLKKCGEGEHKKAAVCFTLAGRYETAADIYAKHNCFSECLSVCSKGHLYDMGLQYVEYWKQHVQERGKEIDGIEQEFLESCASDFFDHNDRKSMMKFVKAFKSLDHKRKFLKPLDCLDELLLLEEESGNFAEAAELAKLKGDLLREADLLGKAGNFSKASSRILWYVLANSLWVRGCWAAWPLKSFESKDELLKKAISFASNESDAFYKSVCTEAKVLSHDPSSLCELRRALSALQKCGSLKGEILCLRKIIDAHTQINATKYSWEDKFPFDLKYPDDTMFCDQLSVGTLCHFWNLWKRNILDVLESLNCLEVQDFGIYKGYGEFCLNYFGVRRQFTDMKVSYLLLNPDAEWVKKVNQSFLRQSKNMVSIDVRHFIIAARNYWQNEVLAVGLKVLETLESLYNFSLRSSSLFSQSMCLVNIYIIAKDLHCKNYEAKLRKFFQLSMQYFEKVFPLDYQKPLEENMISLRGTQASRQLLEEFIVNDLSRKGDLTLGQIGRLMMIWLGSAEPADELCNKIFERTREDSNWRAFIDILRSVRVPLNETTSAGSQEASPVDPCEAGFLLVSRFHESLKETYQINWQNICDYISPHCFLYLVERFLILAFCSRGFFYTTKSSFLEWLIFQKPGVSVIAGFPTGLPFSEIFCTTITSMVDWLLFHKIETARWIEKSKIQFRNYHKLLISRLVVILCSLCMNTSSGEPWDALTRALKTHYISFELPREFNAVFIRRVGKHNAFVDRVKVAEALRVLGNPALFVNLKENTPTTSVCPNTFYLGIGPNSSKEDIMEMMFPNKSVTSVAQKSVKNPCCVLPLIADHARKTSLLPSPGHASTQNQAQKDEEVKSTLLQMKWHVLEEESVSTRTGETENEGKARILATTSFKSSEDLNECIQFMTSVVNYMSGKETQSGEDADMLKEAESMLQELKQLLDKLDTSCVDEEEKRADVVKLQKSLQSRKPRLVAFLNNIVVGKDGGEVTFVDSERDGAANQGSAEVVDEDAGNVVATPSESGGVKNQGERNKAKAKNKSKNRKGKGGRRR
ncbi:PREDICTED: uncharacterized protein LOC109161799 isoform X2 [Ipomoea nil]|uniref:uncharacterized protein LOC109161799 isoform X2 n=1 Tax=Ipomoea nil TaxID=35883 RepID=UPI0009010438|nr:PREDICTED: uncharacterized protein LOC109161799 isoform X2 [Ipomoea nil]